MKKLIINVSLLLVGTLVVLIAMLAMTVFWMEIPDLWRQIRSRDLVADAALFFVIIGLYLTLVYVITMCGIIVLKRGLKESVQPWVVLKKGSLVMLVSENRANNTVMVRMYPFKGRREVLDYYHPVAFPSLKEDWKYIWDGKFLQSVVELRG